MAKTIVFILLLTIVMAVASYPQSARGWRGIVPLKSTRADVERLLGHPNGENFSVFSEYDLPAGRVTVYYSQHRCDDRWNVPPDTVLGISIQHRSIPLADLNVDLRKYKKEPGDYDVPDHFYYRDHKRGFSISVRSGVIEGYNYEPTRAEKILLRCRNAAGPGRLSATKE